ncbi:HotDog domain-containing protein [Kickxella alabastrina]|uniref:HotDog domain-containing protein n=1 Tax=Kickxella alabastrina TaxID=61397 RepID=UPI00221F6840|nr:HotDog domain-containing protein [Kickxella alabastrina]KAI7834792.1 HotDog domain-containing protein [Kickxella alabastrina]
MLTLIDYANENVCGHPGLIHGGMTTVIAHSSMSLVAAINAPGKSIPIFTANFQLEYLEPVLTDSFVVMDAWITAVEGRKSYIASYLADATTGKVLVKAKSLFVSAA